MAITKSYNGDMYYQKEAGYKVTGFEPSQYMCTITVQDSKGQVSWDDPSSFAPDLSGLMQVSVVMLNCVKI